MSDETRRVLDLLAQGKITVDEADQLLGALKTPVDAASSSADQQERPRPRYFRISVNSVASDSRPEKERVNIRVPMSIVKSGLRIASLIPGRTSERINESLRACGVDLDLAKLDYQQLETLISEIGELTIDVDDGKEQVRIGCE